MGIQDRDYYHDRHRHHAGVTDRRDYSQRLRELEASGKTIDIEVDQTDSKANQTTPYSIGILLLASFVFALGYVVYKLAKTFF